jgi:protein-S-isoprenylcysteine O-methyltransferase Ste14
MTVMIGKIAWVVLVVGWYIIRYPFERKAKKTRTEVSSRDRAEWTRMIISATGLGLLPVLSLATHWFSFANYIPSPIQTGLGLLTGLAAWALFRLTHVALGRFWSVSLDIRAEHRLVTEGIYAKLRHPMYSAFWLMALAQALLLPNWFAGCAGLLGFGFLFFARIGPEEKMMEDRFGLAYKAYCERTFRIIPGIW